MVVLLRLVLGQGVQDAVQVLHRIKIEMKREAYLQYCEEFSEFIQTSLPCKIFLIFSIYFIAFDLQMIWIVHVILCILFIIFLLLFFFHYFLFFLLVAYLGDFIALDESLFFSMLSIIFEYYQILSKIISSLVIFKFKKKVCSYR